MKKVQRKQRKREQLIDSSDDDGDDTGVTLSTDDTGAVDNNDEVRLKVKLLTEHVSGDDRETEVTAQIVSETSYEDWEVDIKTWVICLPGGYSKNSTTK